MSSERSRSGAANASAKRAASPERVDDFLAALDHPFRAEIVAIREVILGADPRIGEGIKWNAPSFRTSSEFFATVHLRAKEGVQVILHLGARKRGGVAVRAAIADPESLLEWLADDRASARFRDVGEIEAKRDAFAAVLRHWIEHA